MSEFPQSQPDTAAPESAASTWQRLKERKVVQWTLAYIALAYGLLHGVEMVSHAFEWPPVVIRLTTLALALGIPVAALLAWYHGDRAQHRVSGAELTILTVLFLVGGTVLWMLARTSQEHPSAAPGQATTQPDQSTTLTRDPALTSRASIAVVPFANLTGEPAKEYFSDGMAEELINTLAGVPGLKVPARTSSFAYKGRNTDVRQIARDLGVSTVLEGSVRSAGERIRVTAQLVDGNTGYHLWSQSYDRKFTDLFKLQEELATAIVQALRQQMHAELPSMAKLAPPTEDLEAYELYLQAQSLISRSGAENLRTARELLQKATVRDAQFARAFSLIGVTHLISFGSDFSSDIGELVKAEQAARQSLSLDPDLGAARAVLAQVNAYRGNWLAAQQDFQAVLSLNAEDARIHAGFAIFLMTVGHVREALQASREADRLAPGVASFALNMAGISSILGLDADAVRFANKAVNLGASPDLPMLGIFYSHAAYRRGDAAEAGAQMAKALSQEVRQSGGADTVKLIYAALGDTSKKRAALDALRELRADSAGMNSSLMVVHLATWYTMLGALDSAYEVASGGLENLRRSGAIGGSWGGLWIPEMRPFRQDPRFQALADRLGLMEYWTQYGPPDNCELRDGRLTCH
jgi:TolB-like protein/Tfp pilus assembly protein PilF